MYLYHKALCGEMRDLAVCSYIEKCPTLVHLSTYIICIWGGGGGGGEEGGGGGERMTLLHDQKNVQICLVVSCTPLPGLPV